MKYLTQIKNSIRPLSFLLYLMLIAAVITFSIAYCRGSYSVNKIMEFSYSLPIMAFMYFMINIILSFFFIQTVCRSSALMIPRFKTRFFDAFLIIGYFLVSIPLILLFLPLNSHILLKGLVRYLSFGIFVWGLLFFTIIISEKNGISVVIWLTLQVFFVIFRDKIKLSFLLDAPLIVIYILPFCGLLMIFISRFLITRLKEDSYLFEPSTELISGKRSPDATTGPFIQNMWGIFFNKTAPPSSTAKRWQDRIKQAALYIIRSEMIYYNLISIPTYIFSLVLLAIWAKSAVKTFPTTILVSWVMISFGLGNDNLKEDFFAPLTRKRLILLNYLGKHISALLWLAFVCLISLVLAIILKEDISKLFTLKTIYIIANYIFLVSLMLLVIVRVNGVINKYIINMVLYFLSIFFFYIRIRKLPPVELITFTGLFLILTVFTTAISYQIDMKRDIK